MSRSADVSSLLRDCEIKHSMIKSKYDEALKNESMDLRIPVKNLMENLRSALDYMAQDIYEIICKPDRVARNLPDPRNIYFPYAKAEADFRSRVGASLPNLETLSQVIYNHLLSIQPCKCNDTWLYDLCSILNENKHDRLVPQTRKETETYSVKNEKGSVSISRAPGVSITSMPSAVRIMGVPAEFRGDHIATHPAGGLKHEITRWVAFNFEGTSVNILGLFEKSVPGIRDFSEKLYSLMSNS